MHQWFVEDCKFITYKFDLIKMYWTILSFVSSLKTKYLISVNYYCVVPRCSVTFWTHRESIPVGQFFRRWIRSINQSINQSTTTTNPHNDGRSHFVVASFG